MGKNKYRITFFSQYGALSYSRLLQKEGIPSISKPVPRHLSSSCGICLEVETDINILDRITDDIERVYLLKEDSQEVLLLENE